MFWLGGSSWKIMYPGNDGLIALAMRVYYRYVATISWSLVLLSDASHDLRLSKVLRY